MGDIQLYYPELIYLMLLFPLGLLGKVLLGQIGASGVVDPINSLGSCADENKKFDLNTCWRERR